MNVNRHELNMILAALRITATGYDARAVDRADAQAAALSKTYGDLSDRLGRGGRHDLTAAEHRLIVNALQIAALGYEARAREQRIRLQRAEADQSETFAIACAALSRQLQGKRG